MEHQTMTTLSDFSYDLVAHELSHMWFGDNVTCGTWQDIWINEGFATYSPFLATEYLTGEFPVEQQGHGLWGGHGQQHGAVRCAQAAWPR